MYQISILYHNSTYYCFIQNCKDTPIFFFNLQIYKNGKLTGEIHIIQGKKKVTDPNRIVTFVVAYLFFLESVI